MGAHSHFTLANRELVYFIKFFDKYFKRLKMGLMDIVPAGVVTGDNLLKLMEYCRDNAIALPAFNCTSTSTINAVLQAARDIKSPVIIQFSNGGAAFLAGKGIKNDKQKAAILGSIAGAQHVRLMAKHYGIPVIIHSDHCAKKLLEWFDGMLEADEAYFKEHGEPLFSSHMLDLSEEFDEENIATCAKYFKRMAGMKWKLASLVAKKMALTTLVSRLKLFTPSLSK